MAAVSGVIRFRNSMYSGREALDGWMAVWRDDSVGRWRGGVVAGWCSVMRQSRIMQSCGNVEKRVEASSRDGTLFYDKSILTRRMEPCHLLGLENMRSEGRLIGHPGAGVDEGGGGGGGRRGEREGRGVRGI